VVQKRLSVFWFGYKEEGVNVWLQNLFGRDFVCSCFQQVSRLTIDVVDTSRRVKIDYQALSNICEA